MRTAAEVVEALEKVMRAGPPGDDDLICVPRNLAVELLMCARDARDLPGRGGGGSP